MYSEKGDAVLLIKYLPAAPAKDVQQISKLSSL
jgi:hypothetical protein